MNTKERNINLDILRCLSMLGIVAMHTCVHGSSIQLLQTEEFNADVAGLAEIAIVGIFVIAVNLFFLISGYFGMRFNRKKACALCLEANLYSTGMYVLAAYLGAEKFAVKHLIENILWGGVNYWFLVVYMLIYLISDYYNKILDQMSDNELKTYIIAFFAINVFLGFLLENQHYGSPFSVLPMLFIYSCGRTLNRMQSGKLSNIKISAVYFLATFLTVVGTLFAIQMHKQKPAYKILTSYCSPLVIIASLCAFLLFLQNRPFCKTHELQAAISKISASTFAVYLLTDSISSRKFIYEPIKNYLENNAFVFVIILGYSIILFLVCIIVDCIRIKVMNCIKSIDLKAKM